MKKIVFIWVLFFWFVGIGSGSLSCVAAASWQNDFDMICAHTADAGKLSSEELISLIAESEELLQIIESSDDPRKKLYLIRLKKCRNFFIFMEEIAENPEDN